MTASCGGCREGEAQARRKSFARFVSSHFTNLCNELFPPPLTVSKRGKSKWSAGPTLAQALDSSLAVAEKWDTSGYSQSCQSLDVTGAAGIPRNKKHQGAPDRKSGAGQKYLLRSTRLTQISARGLSLSKRQSPAQQLAFCAAQPYPARAGWEKNKQT